MSSDDDEQEVDKKPMNKHLHGANHRNSGQLMHSKFHGSKGALPSPLGSAHSFDLQVRIFKISFDYSNLTVFSRFFSIFIFYYNFLSFSFYFLNFPSVAFW